MALHDGSITRRRVDCDITILTLEGTDVVNYFQNCAFTFSAELIDVSSALDAWVHRESCRKDCEFTLGKIMYEDEDLATMFLSGGSVYVCCDIAGKTLYFIGVLENVNVTSGNPMSEGATIRIANGTPSLT